MMLFAEAINAAIRGAAIRRKAWYGANMRVVYMPPCVVPAANVTKRTLEHWPVGRDLELAGYFVEVYEDRWVPGWHPSSDDMLAEDWEATPPLRPEDDP